jgi:hypothetical protein
MLRNKPPVLKPQDLFVVLKMAANRDRRFTYSELAGELYMSASEVHAASLRAELSRLLAREDGRVVPVRSALQEFVVHGVKYAFPALSGAIVRGLATGVGAPPLKDLFSPGDGLPHVWPDVEGKDRGPSLQPLYSSVPAAARVDWRLYELLALIDALRVGAAREREAATSELLRRL